MPHHEVTNNMFQKRSLFLWRLFHLQEEIDKEDDLDKEKNEGNKAELVEVGILRIDKEQEVIKDKGMDRKIDEKCFF